jgi:sulfur carrier protein ThiS
MQRKVTDAWEAFIINDQKVSREDYADIAINGDDEVVLLPPIKGG